MATIRRNIEQIVHCAREALSVIENGEDHLYAINDLSHASGLIDEVLKILDRRQTKTKGGEG